MSSEPPPNPVCDNFNYSQWNATEQSATRAWVKRNFLSKVIADIAQGVISFMNGIKTNSILVYSGTTLTIGENDNTKSVNLWYPTLANSKPISSVNNTTLASTEWVNSWFSYVKGLEQSWTQINTYSVGIETNQINGSNLANEVNLYSTNNQQGNLNILNFDYPASVARPNINIACGVSNDLTKTKSKVNILTGNSFGSFNVGGINSTCSFTGDMNFNSGVNSTQGISVMSGNYFGSYNRPNLEIMTSTNIDPLSYNGNVNIQSGNSNGKVTIGNSLSSIDLKAGTMTLYNSFTPNYGYPVGAGKIGQIIPFTSYTGGTGTFSTGVTKTYGTIPVPTSGIYLLNLTASIYWRTGGTIQRYKIYIQSAGGLNYGIMETYNQTAQIDFQALTLSVTGVVSNSTSTNYSVFVLTDFTGTAPEATNTNFIFQATRIA